MEENEMKKNEPWISKIWDMYRKKVERRKQEA
jgi:hypothetical protein